MLAVDILFSLGNESNVERKVKKCVGRAGLLQRSVLVSDFSFCAGLGAFKLTRKITAVEARGLNQPLERIDSHVVIEWRHTQPVSSSRSKRLCAGQGARWCSLLRSVNELRRRFLIQRKGRLNLVSERGALDSSQFYTHSEIAMSRSRLNWTRNCAQLGKRTLGRVFVPLRVGR
jgi:hypothetical protein